MKTNLSQQYRLLDIGKEAEKIVLSCVHCGFCTATCPTYQLTSNELDSPRGRIYLIKEFMEGGEITQQVQHHLDRCLTCHNCQTTCPSGVDYHRLIDIGRSIIAKENIRPLVPRTLRKLINSILPYRQRFNFFLTLGRMSRPLLPAKLKLLIPVKPKLMPLSKIETECKKGKVMLFGGCVQPDLAPQINHHVEKIISKLGYEVCTESKATCCGAINHHCDDPQKALQFITSNLATWENCLNNEVEMIIFTASGCLSMVKNYKKILPKSDPYYDKVADIVDKCVDISQFILQNLEKLTPDKRDKENISFHPPCTLTNDLQLSEQVKSILKHLGFELNPIIDEHLCCGSAGTYSILQPKISKQLKINKINQLIKNKPKVIVTANIGCMLHLQTATEIPVKHWIELI